MNQPVEDTSLTSQVGRFDEEEDGENEWRGVVCFQ